MSISPKQQARCKAVMTAIEERWKDDCIDSLHKLEDLGYDIDADQIQIGPPSREDFLLEHLHGDAFQDTDYMDVFDETIFMGMIDNGLDIPWKDISQHPNMSMESILLSKDAFPWDWKYVSINDNMTMEMYINIRDNHPEIFDQLDHQYAIQQYIPVPQKYVDIIPSLLWDHSRPFNDTQLDIEYAMENIPFSRVSMNANLTLQIIKDNIDKDWDWARITVQKTIGLQDIIDNPQLPWVMNKIHKNPNFGIDWILAFNGWILAFNGKVALDWRGISDCEEGELTIKDIMANPQLPWDRWMVSQRSDVNMEYILDQIKAGKSRSLCWGSISNFADISPQEILEHHKLPWVWYSIADHSFAKVSSKREYIISETRKHLAAHLIQNAWLNAQVNPYCKVGINRIRRDYDECT
jgi:hypothetical protein